MSTKSAIAGDDPGNGRPCDLCGKRHEWIDEETKAGYRAMGFTEYMIKQIVAENQRIYHPEDSSKNATREHRAEAMRRYRARQKAQQNGERPPRWASKRKK